MWLLASAYNKREGILELYAFEIDKRNGEMKAGWKHLSTLRKDAKKDDIGFQFSYNADSSKMILVNTLEGKDKAAFEVEEFDENMKKVGKTTKISTSFEAKTFQLQDVSGDHSQIAAQPVVDKAS